MFVVGVDLSGPGNVADTVLAAFRSDGQSLRLQHTIHGATDQQTYEFVAGLPLRSRIAVGLDAPLSYNPGGGDRPGDRALRRAAMAAGLKSGSVMPPTLTRMVYLTVRGITVARMLADIGHPKLAITEVHPGAAMALRGAPVEVVRNMKSDPSARTSLVRWLETNGLAGVITREDPSDHYVASCAAALAAWKWANDEPAWLEPAKLPTHPFDYVA